MKKVLLVFVSIFGLITSQAWASNKVINVCGGGLDGTYHLIANDITDALNKHPTFKERGFQATIQMEDHEGYRRPVYRGSLANLDAAADGKCDIFVSQPDAFVWFTGEYPQESSYFKVYAQAGTEYIIPFCNKNSGDDLEIIEDEGTNTVAVVAGAGDYAFFNNLPKVDSDYKIVDMIYASDSYNAAKKVAMGEADCSVAITSLESQSVSDIIDSFGDDLIFATASDGDFNDPTYVSDGETLKLYRYESVSKDYLKGIERSDTWGSMDVLTMERQIVINEDIFNNMSSGDERRLRRIVKDVIKTVGGKY